MEAESTIQEIIKEDFNKIHFKARQYYVDTEAYTKNGNRADVLFGFKRKNQIYIAVVEVKTRKTLQNLKPQTDPNRKVKWARIITFVLFISTFVYWQIETYLDTYILASILTTFICVAIFIGHFIEKKRLRFVLSIPAIDQLKKYPAHEKWIGITADTFVKNKDYQTLLKSCKKEHIGLMIVHHDGFIEVKLKPVPANEGNRYIDNYIDKTPIINHLQNAYKGYRTPSEKSKSFRYISYAAMGIFALIFITSLMNRQPGLKHKNNVPLSFAPIKEKPMNPKKITTPTDQPVKQDDEFTEKGLAGFETEEQPCDFFDIQTKHIMLLVAISKSYSEAKRMVTELNNTEVEDFAFVHSSCINTWIKPERYIVHTNTFYQDWSDAKNMGTILKENLAKNGINCKRCKPLTLEPNN